MESEAAPPGFDAEQEPRSASAASRSGGRLPRKEPPATILAAAEVVLDLEAGACRPCGARSARPNRFWQPGRLVIEACASPAGERSARFARLKDILARHFEGERAGLFPKAADSSLDLDKLGGEMLEFKARLAQARSRRPFASFLS
jgi:hypothetical protein